MDLLDLLFDHTMQGETQEVKTAMANILLVSLYIKSFGTPSKIAFSSNFLELEFQPKTTVCRTKKTKSMTKITQKKKKE